MNKRDWKKWVNSICYGPQNQEYIFQIAIKAP